MNAKRAVRASLRVSWAFLAFLHASPTVAGPLAQRLDIALGDLSAAAPAPLMDRAAPFAARDRLDGTPTAARLPAGEWRQLLRELRTAGVAASPGTWEALGDRSVRAAAGAVPLGLVDVQVATIRPEAVEEGLLTADGDRLRALSADAFRTGRIVAAAPLAGTAWRGPVRFVLDPALILTDGPLPTRVEADFGDGLGLRPLPAGQAVEARWTSPGEKELRLRVTYADGAVRHANTGFRLAALGTPVPDDTLFVTAAVPWNGSAAGGEAYVYLAPGHASLTRPVVVLEGFDLEDTYDWEQLYELLNAQNLVETLRSEDRDLVVLNFDDATEPIQRNGLLAAELIEQVNAITGAPEEITVIGASMGGLVGRYALAWMEQQAIPHHTKTYITFDTPHFGANIPLGIQYWLDFFQDESADAAALLASLDTPAARQMLTYHHTTPPSGIGVSDPLRPAFLADLAAVGDWPTGPRLVGFANGSAQGAGHGFGPGGWIIEYEHRSFAVDIDGDVYAVPDGGSALILDGRVDIIFLPPDVLQVTVSGTQPYDSVPGGYRDSMAQMDAVEAPYGDIKAKHPNHCFIPTVSALAIAGAPLDFDVDGTPDLASLTPFDAVYFPSTSPNQEHVEITAETAQWLLDEVLADDATGVPGVGIASGADGLRLTRIAPNPFRSATDIGFSLPQAATVDVDVFDVTGRRVASPARSLALEAGTHGVTWDAHRFPAGVYFLRVTADGRQAGGRLVRID
jgi:hypothetical protein